MYARLRPIRSATLLPIRMNAADTSASSAIADCTPLAVVPRSCTTAAIDTFMNDVSTTSTNIAIASRIASFLFPDAGASASIVRHCALRSAERSACGLENEPDHDRDHDHIQHHLRRYREPGRMGPGGDIAEPDRREHCHGEIQRADLVQSPSSEC